MKTIFWNVDTQYDFMRNDETFRGSLAITGAGEIEGNLEFLTKLAAARMKKVVNTADMHTLQSPEISVNPDFKTTFPAHCLRGTIGAAYIPATIPEAPYIIDWAAPRFDSQRVQDARNIVLYKDRFDIFHPQGAPHTLKVLEIIKPDRVIVYGVATNVCVDFAVRGLLNFHRGIEVYVPADAIKELPNLPLDEMLDAWRDAGTKLIRTNEVAKYLGE